MSKLKDNQNLPLIITILVTLIISALAIVLLASSSGDKMTAEEKKSALLDNAKHIAGNKDAAIQVVEFSDYECPACANYYPDLKKIKEQYGNQIGFTFRNFPLETIHPLARTAALAAEAASAQGKFWEYHDNLYEKQAEWSDLNKEQAITKFIEYARNIQIADISKFESDVRNATYNEVINKDIADGDAINVNGTPSVFVNGKQVNPTYESLATEIENNK